MTHNLTSYPFDEVAAGYDAAFTRRRLGRWLRAEVQDRLGDAFQPGDWVLELGCGTGEDAVWLARHGVRVAATDASPVMLEVARGKVHDAGLAGSVHLAQLDLRTVSDGGQLGSVAQNSGTGIQPQPPTLYAGAFSDFGALNCLPDRRPLASWLARRIRPGGQLVLVVMSPICPWEITWHIAHGQLRTAFRRFRRGADAFLAEDVATGVWYPTPRRLRAEFAPKFRHVSTFGIGVLLPPPYLDHLVERWPRPFERLAAWGRRIGGVFPCTWLNDHYLMVLERV